MTSQTVTVKTNNVPRDLIWAHDLNVAQHTKLRQEFDYMSDEDFQGGMFFQYRGEFYSLSEFLTLNGDLLAQGWQGICGQTAFSGLVVKIVESCTSVVVGSYCV